MAFGVFRCERTEKLGGKGIIDLEVNRLALGAALSGYSDSSGTEVEDDVESDD
jgi:hypothetical protein